MSKHTEQWLSETEQDRAGRERESTSMLCSYIQLYAGGASSCRVWSEMHLFESHRKLSIFH